MRTWRAFVAWPLVAKSVGPEFAGGGQRMVALFQIFVLFQAGDWASAGDGAIINAATAMETASKQRVALRISARLRGAQIRHRFAWRILARAARKKLASNLSERVVPRASYCRDASCFVSYARRGGLTRFICRLWSA